MAPSEAEVEHCLLVFTDIHYRPPDSSLTPSDPVPDGRKLIQSVWQQARRIAEPEGILILGDLLDDGNADGAATALRTLRDDLKGFGVPVMVARGNHDVNVEFFRRVFPEQEIEIGPYLVLAFDDSYDESDRARRSGEEFVRLSDIARNHPNRPILCLQHNPVHPPIDHEYPFVIQHKAAVMDAYQQAGVILSLSSHYHLGQPPTMERGVTYFTGRAVCEPPHPFYLLHLQGREARIYEYSLLGGE